MMMRKKHFLILLISSAISCCEPGKKDLQEVQQMRCQARFFDRYQSQFDIVLRIRRNILEHYAQHRLSIEQQEDFQQLQNKIDGSLIKLLADFGHFLKDTDADIEQHFFSTKVLHDRVIEKSNSAKKDIEAPVVLDDQIDLHSQSSPLSFLKEIINRGKRFFD